MISSRSFLRTAVGLVLAAVSVTGFASTFVSGGALTKHEGVSPEVLAFLRFAIAGAILFAVEASVPKKRARLFAVTRRDWGTILWLGPVGTALMAWFVFLGCARVSTANTSMADAWTPIVIFFILVAKTRRVALQQVLALLCGLAGATLVIQIFHAGGCSLSAFSPGDLFVFLSAASWGVYTVCGRDLIARYGSSVFTVWTMLAGAAALGLVLLCFGRYTWPATGHAWLLVASLALFSTLMAFWTWNAAQKFLPATVLGICAYFTPVVAVALAYVFLGEKATLLQWCGTLLVVLAAVFELRAQKSHA